MTKATTSAWRDMSTLKKKNITMSERSDILMTRCHEQVIHDHLSWQDWTHLSISSSPGSFPETVRLNRSVGRFIHKTVNVNRSVGRFLHLHMPQCWTGPALQVWHCVQLCFLGLWIGLVLRIHDLEDQWEETRGPYPPFSWFTNLKINRLSASSCILCDWLLTS